MTRLEARAPRPVPETGSPPSPGRAPDAQEAERLLCRACREPITSSAARVPVAGSHVHRRTNPAGIQFRFGCFDAAPGAATVGPATGEHSWFAGCTWSLAMCGACGDHLGWRFQGAESFYGLILDRLVEEQRPLRH